MPEVRGITDLIKFYCEADRGPGVTYEDWCDLAAAAVRGFTTQRQGHSGLLPPTFLTPDQRKEWTKLQNCRGSVQDYIKLSRFAINKADLLLKNPNRIGEEIETDAILPPQYQQELVKFLTVTIWEETETETESTPQAKPLVYKDVTDIDIAHAMSQLNSSDPILKKMPITVVCGAKGTPWIALKFDCHTFWADKDEVSWKLREAKDPLSPIGEYRAHVVKGALEKAIAIVRQSHEGEMKP